MIIRYYIDPETDLPHIYKHNVNEEEVEAILIKPGEDRPGREGYILAIGQTETGRFLRDIYVPDAKLDSVFVVTAYELSGNVLKAYRRRRWRKI
jgi:hypothetical protein